MNDHQLIAAIEDIRSRSAALGLPISTMRNSHVGPALIIPSAPEDLPIPRGFFIEEEVPTGPMVGGFPTFRSAGLNDILDISEIDHAMMDEIGRLRDASRSGEGVQKSYPLLWPLSPLRLDPRL